MTAGGPGQPAGGWTVVDGITVFPTDDPAAWQYLPPGEVVRLPDGRRSLSVVEAGPIAYLTVTTHLFAGPDLLTALRRSLADRVSVAADRIALTVVPVRRAAAELIIGEGNTPAATSFTSGTIGWDAAFQVSLDADAARQVRAGLSGRRDRLRIRYRVIVVPRTAGVTGTTISMTSSTVITSSSSTSSSTSSGRPTDSSARSAGDRDEVNPPDGGEDPPFAATANADPDPQIGQTTTASAGRHEGSHPTDPAPPTPTPGVEFVLDIDAADWI
ncbi:hypothetical protein [Nakamurella lactea]|uniref:hypothetical protein n=1 Tax=Nakamurella lactea TaxID=459515 RepID=UPI0004143F44|nr:hypothetical protein [Nakamurella lactea]